MLMKLVSHEWMEGQHINFTYLSLTNIQAVCARRFDSDGKGKANQLSRILPTS